MGKNNLNIQIIVGLCVSFLISCNNDTIESRYYRYSIGKIIIEKPVLVEMPCKTTWVFYDEYFECPEFYVCPDSALYSINDSSWLQRPDVYPYIIISFEELQYTTEEDPTLYPSTYYTNNRHKHPLKTLTYPPYYYLGSIISKKIKVYSFYYGINVFDAFLQATKSYWYDISDPLRQDPDADSCDFFHFNNEYRIVVSAHYNWWQILKLHFARGKCIDANGEWRNVFEE